jgi:hypothetical protein
VWNLNTYMDKYNIFLNHASAVYLSGATGIGFSIRGTIFLFPIIVQDAAVRSNHLSILVDIRRTLTDSVV